MVTTQRSEWSRAAMVALAVPMLTIPVLATPAPAQDRDMRADPRAGDPAGIAPPVLAVPGSGPVPLAPFLPPRGSAAATPAEQTAAIPDPSLPDPSLPDPRLQAGPQGPGAGNLPPRGGTAVPELQRPPGGGVAPPVPGVLGQVPAGFEVHGELVLVSGQLEGFHQACGFGRRPDREELLDWYRHHRLARSEVRVRGIYELGLELGREGPCTVDQHQALTGHWQGLMARTRRYVDLYR